jgi:protein O-GlcNAc transferase
VFVGDPRAPVTEAFRARLTAAFRARGADPDTQLCILPRLEKHHWNAVLAHGDLFLDGPGWAGGMTTLEALAHGLPPLAFPGDTMRGRHALAMVRELGLADALSPETPDAWVARAIALAHDPAERGALRLRIVERRGAMFEDRRGVEMLADVLEAAARG